MTGKSRDLGYRQLKALAKGYVCGTLHLSKQPESGCPCRLLHISTSGGGLKTTTGWRNRGREALCRVSRAENPVKIEERVR